MARKTVDPRHHHADGKMSEETRRELYAKKGEASEGTSEGTDRQHSSPSASGSGDNKPNMGHQGR